MPPSGPPPPRRSALPTPPSSSAILPSASLGSADAESHAEIMHESTGSDGKGSDMDTAPYHTALISLQAIEVEDEKELESHDEFEDAAEEMVNKPSDQESNQREAKREQNERASRLIGEKMLQGWTMLQDACPNSACYGVPLMRSREKKEYCVICENYYKREQDLEPGKYSTVSTAKPNGVDATTAAVAFTASQFPAPPMTLPPVPRTSPVSNPTTVSALTSPQVRAVSPLSSPSHPRASVSLHGRISSSIVLPPAASVSPSFGMTSQQILSESMDKASEDEESRRRLQLIGKVDEFAVKSLPPVPPVVPTSPVSVVSRPTSTYSFSSERERSPRHLPYHHHQPQQQGISLHSTQHDHNNNARISPPQQQQQQPVPLSPEVQAIVNATHKTMSTLLSKLELYRLAMEVSDNPKECQALANQIKGIMECLKVCREVL
ncbi:hypothetical protein BGX28_003900 [Mortierella sp. GBA30]|nr:hypothetical protein BGX28_003900 [Mortierella sp. GBA30]